mgnify:CR=1 FL=1
MRAMDTPAYLTTREVADLLRVKERKVYDLAAAGEIPHRRITGKLLFPHAELVGWIERGAGGPAADTPPVVTGSHDPLLDWAVREVDAGLATLWNGSGDGLVAFAEGRAALAGLHLPEPDGWNVDSVAARGLSGCVLIGWAVRMRGLLVAPHAADRVAGITDLRGLRVARRQPGAGAATLLDRLLDDAGLGAGDTVPARHVARTESDAAAMVAGGEADAALGIAAMARRYSLAFVPLTEERYDLLIDRRAYFTPPVQALVAFARTAAFADRAAALGGYDIGAAGAVRWLSP